MAKSSQVRPLLVFFFCLLLCTINAVAQTGTTSLHGTVLDNARSSVGGAKVMLVNVDQHLQREQVTPASGEFDFVSLPPGKYELTVEKEGFQKQEQKGLDLLVNKPTTLNIVLQVGIVSTRVQVSAQAENINTTDASLGAAFNEQQVKQLPLESRNVPDLLSLQAGVVYTGNSPDIDQNKDTRSGSVNGSHSDQGNVTVDGIPANGKGAYAFQSVLPVTLDSVEEFRVTTSNWGADQGVSSGAQVALVTKSGTNNFHGSAYEYNRNSYFSANDYFIKAAQLESGEPNKPQQLNRNIFGGSLGGPIIKDRLFFFANYEGFRDSEAISAVRTVPTAALQDGVIQYLCPLNADGSLNTAACPGNTVQGLSGKSYTAPAGNYALSPGNITTMDTNCTSSNPCLQPFHGPNPTVLQYMQQTFGKFLPNDQTTGDLLNTAGYRFRAPTHTTKNWYIAKVDYNLTKDAKQRVSVSGALENDTIAGAPFLPGSAPEETTLNFNKGIIANYSAVIKPTVINNFRYGFVRQSIGTEGDSSKPWNYLSAFDQGITYSSSFQRPTNNFTDDLTWMKGRHTIQMGTQISLLRNPAVNYNNSFDSGYANQNWFLNSGLSTTSVSPLNPANYAQFPAVDTSFQSNYDTSMTSLLGMITLGNANYNYNRQNQPLAPGAPVTRRFAENSYEMYIQDTWKATSTLTITAGLRYSLFSPPWETNGLEVMPTISLNTWFNERSANMKDGIGTNELAPITYDWAGKANGKAGYYNWDFKDFGPRLALAWAPSYDNGLLGAIFGKKGQSSIRAGFSIVYDRAGESLVDTFDQNGSFGLSSVLNNPSNVEQSNFAARLTNMNVIPAADYAGNPVLEPAPPSSFPKTYPIGAGAITWGIDNSLKTPYSYTIDLSVSRELSRGFSFEVAYVGRLSHRLLAQDDLALPADIYDKKAGIDYFAAETALAKVFRPMLNNNVTNATLQFDPSKLPANVQQFWKDQIQPITNGVPYQLSGCTGTDASGNANVLPTLNPVVFAFDTFCSTRFNDSLGLYKLDFNGIPGYDASQPGFNSSQMYYGAEGQYAYYSSQFSSLYAWRSIAPANYNAMQVSIHHQMIHGFQFDFNYTFSKSIDLSSNAERVQAASNSSLLDLNNNIINAWNPNAQRGVSSFDLTHQFNANWIWQLPFGRGQHFAKDANRFVDAIIGGWQFSGLFRLTSGFPVNVDNGLNNYPTNFELEGNANLVAPVKAGVFFNTGTPNIFANGPAAINSFAPAYAGQAGQRDVVRGDGYFGLDIGLAKRWTMPWSDAQSLQFRWEVFNVPNSVRFDVQSSLLSNSLGLGSGGSFGNYSGLLTNPRIMQFALRYEF